MYFNFYGNGEHEGEHSTVEFPSQINTLNQSEDGLIACGNISATALCSAR